MSLRHEAHGKRRLRAIPRRPDFSHSGPSRSPRRSLTDLKLHATATIVAGPLPARHHREDTEANPPPEIDPHPFGHEDRRAGSRGCTKLEAALELVSREGQARPENCANCCWRSPNDAGAPDQSSPIVFHHMRTLGGCRGPPQARPPDPPAVDARHLCSALPGRNGYHEDDEDSNTSSFLTRRS